MIPKKSQHISGREGGTVTGIHPFRATSNRHWSAGSNDESDPGKKSNSTVKNSTIKSQKLELRKSVSINTKRKPIPKNPKNIKHNHKHNNKNFTVSSYNVRTLYETGKFHQLVTGCTQFNLSFIAIQEHRWYTNNDIEQCWTDDGSY